MSDSDDRPFDLVLFGGSSFVGRIVMHHLVRRHGSAGSLRWAVAGRDERKLAAAAADAGADVDILTADAADPAAMRSLASVTRVIASTVGPYARYGSELVAAAATAGTDYCDLTGEPLWMQRMIDRHQDVASTSGARVVHAAGFDSIPSDLGVWFTQQAAIERFGEPCTRMAMRVRDVRGGVSGGTVASLLNVFDEVAAEPALRAILANPHALAPAGHRDGVPQPEVTFPQRDDASGEWVAPFVMAGINTRVVHRTHALLGHPWGSGFRYDEAMMMGSGPLGAAKASALAAGMAAGLGVAAVGPLRRQLARVLPKPGSGPSPKAQESGFFDLAFFGTTRSGRRIEARVTGDRDPGYGSTAKMFAETALAFLDLGRTEVPGGFHTPASAFGSGLVERLTEHAGLTFEVVG